MVKVYISKVKKEARAELKLLLALARGKKSFEQVAEDARDFSYAGKNISALAHCNAARGVTERLVGLTGISKESLDYFPIRFKGEDDESVPKQHPFSLISRRVMRTLAKDGGYFEVNSKSVDPSIVASSFTNSPLYREHPLVQQAAQVGETVVPLSFYSDGISIASSPHEDTLYTIYLSFLNRDSTENAKPEGKHVFITFRKSQMTSDTMNDIVDLWLFNIMQNPFLDVFPKPRFFQAKLNNISCMMWSSLGHSVVGIAGDSACFDFCGVSNSPLQ